jgi:histone H3/H4
MITARTQVKEILKDSGIGADKISNDFLPRLDEKVKELIVNAAKRAKENCRTTVMGRDV